MQRLRQGPLADTAPGAELWLDGGHNPHAAAPSRSASARACRTRPTYLICGMLNTKDVAGFMRPFAGLARHLWAVTIDGVTATLPASDTAAAATAAGIDATEADSVHDAIREIAALDPHARILICGSLYLAGTVLAENG
jgi:dihydrofolate synthase/folylpolyglutamate synthase